MFTRFLLAAAVMLALVTSAAASPVQGQMVLFRFDATHFHNAMVSKVVSGSTVNLVVFASGDNPWPDGSTPGSVGIWVGLSSAEDQSRTTDLTWSDHPNVGLGATGATGATGPTGATGAQGPAGTGSFVTATTTPSFALNGSGIRSSTTLDTVLTFSVRIDATVNLTGGADGTATLLCDANATPVTAVAELRAGNTGTLTIGLALTQTITGELHYRVPANHFCRLTTANNTGTPTFTLVRQVLQTLN